MMYVASAAVCCMVVTSWVCWGPGVHGRRKLHQTKQPRIIFVVCKHSHRALGPRPSELAQLCDTRWSATCISCRTETCRLRMACSLLSGW